MEQWCNTSRVKCELGAKYRQAHWSGGEGNGNLRHNWTCSKPLQSQLADPSSRGPSEIRDNSESDNELWEGLSQMDSSWTPDSDKRVPPLGRKSICIPSSLQAAFRFSRLLYPVSRPWASRRGPTHLRLLVFTGPGTFSFFKELCKVILQEGRRSSMTQPCLRNRGEKWGDPRGTSFLNTSEISNALLYL